MNKLQYTRDQLESKSTSELEWHYMKSFRRAYVSGEFDCLDNLKPLDPSSKLGIITNLLANRDSRIDIQEKRIIHNQIKILLSKAIKDQEYMEEAILTEMLHYYQRNVLG